MAKVKAKGSVKTTKVNGVVRRWHFDAKGNETYYRFTNTQGDPAANTFARWTEYNAKGKETFYLTSSGVTYGKKKNK